jgi:hypothetical protein
MPPRTRTIFLEHQHNIRGDTEERVFVREWNQKSKNDRAAWVNSFNLLQGHRQTKDQLQQEYEQTDQNIRGLYRERPLRAKAFHKAVSTGLEQAQRLRTAAVTLRNQYNAFRALEVAQPGHSPAGLAWSNSRANHCNTWTTYLNTAMARLRAARNGPVTPADENGQHRMPALWFPRDQREILNRRDNTTGLETDLSRGGVGLSQDDGQGLWLPWFKISDGMAKGANGCLWLKFDTQQNDGRVIDVSVATEFFTLLQG